jgi:release factor glutamine methyltransferase
MSLNLGCYTCLVPKRQLTPYEQTHLARYGFSHVNIDEYGEMPVEYITGKVEFADQVFLVTQDTLIPRIETEELVAAAEEVAVKLQTNLGRELIIADVGTGCGAVGITLLQKLKKQNVPVSIYMSDISETAVEVAKKNYEQLVGGSTRNIFVSDLLDAYPTDVMFDLLVANLPYIPTDRIRVLDDSVKEYEPHLALDGGDDGLQHIRNLIIQADKRLHADSTIVLEIDYTHDKSFLQQQLPLTNFNLELQLREDSFHRTRFAILTKKTQSS